MREGRERKEEGKEGMKIGKIKERRKTEVRKGEKRKEGRENGKGRKEGRI